MDMQSSTYIPGTCNIDPEGVRSRKRVGQASLVIGSAALIAAYAMELPPGVRYAIAVSTGFATILNFKQARRKFCVANGLSGKYGNDRAKQAVGSESDRARDRTQSTRMILTTLGLSLLVGVVGLLPL
jgi:hypothetical protein